MKTRTKVIIGVVAAVAVIGAGAGIAASFAPSTEGTFLTEEVQIRDVDVTVAASGSVSPSKELGLQFPAAATATLETLCGVCGRHGERGAGSRDASTRVPSRPPLSLPKRLLPRPCLRLLMLKPRVTPPGKPFRLPIKRLPPLI